MELTLTTEFMSGMSGTSTSGARRKMRRVVEPEAVAKSTITRLTPREYCRDISPVSGSWFAELRTQALGIDVTIWIGASPLAAGRAEGPQQAGPLIARSKEERQQSEGCRIHQQDALAARRKSTSQRCHQAGFAHAAGQREDGQHRSARRHRSRNRLRLRTRSFKNSPQRKPA